MTRVSVIFSDSEDIAAAYRRNDAGRSMSEIWQPCPECNMAAVFGSLAACLAELQNTSMDTETLCE